MIPAYHYLSEADAFLPFGELSAMLDSHGVRGRGRDLVLRGQVAIECAPNSMRVALRGPAPVVTAADVPERAAGETDTGYASRVAALIEARRASAKPARVDASPVPAHAPAPAHEAAARAAGLDMGDRVAELMRSRREGRQPAAWATRPQQQQAPALTADALLLRDGESQTAFAKRLVSTWPGFRRKGS